MSADNGSEAEFTSDHVFGEHGAAHEVIHYGDYRSADSGRLHEALKTVVDGDGLPVRYVFRYLPVMDGNVLESGKGAVHDQAIAAAAAARQGKAWEMHESLFRFASDADAIVKAAEAAGLDMERFAADCEALEVQADVERHLEEVSKANVDRVPTLVIRGEEYLGAWDPESLQEAIHPPVARQIKEVATKFAAWAAASGAILIAFALVALLLCNSPLSEAYRNFWHLEAGFVIADHSLIMSLHHWVNDLLMAVFFLVVGLELKRELLSGELSDWRSAIVPAAAAVGGMLMPAFCFAAFTWGTDLGKGWGIPMATDIAFTLGVLALLGTRIPTSLLVFATALAVVDDLGAILVLAAFYNHGIVWEALGFAAFLLVVLIAFNRARVYVIWPYLAVGLLLWIAVYFSGVHATIAGVLLAMTIPTRSRAPLRPLLVQQASSAQQSRQLLRRRKTSDNLERTRLAERIRVLDRRLNPSAERMEKTLQPWSSFFVLPLFALANAGIAFSVDSIWPLDRLSLGIIFGLVIGKPLGIVLATWLVERLGLGRKPDDANWSHIVAVGFLCGIGFTMSIFITNEAFEADQKIATAKLAVMIASVLAALCGMIWLSVFSRLKLTVHADS